MHWAHTKNRETIIEKIRISKMGDKNHQWKGDRDIYAKTGSHQYHAIHIWLNRNYNHLKKECEHCSGKRFLEWALKKGESHAHSIKKYLILCSSCHKKYDYTDERREKMRKAMTNRKITWGKKIGDANRGRLISKETKKKISAWNKKHPRKHNEKGQFTSS